MSQCLFALDSGGLLSACTFSSQFFDTSGMILTETLKNTAQTDISRKIFETFFNFIQRKYFPKRLCLIEFE